MNLLESIVKDEQRVLTTNQLAEAFGTDSKIINRNFQRNTDRYVQGKHYFSLTGQELREFKGSRQNDDSLKFASVLYLWTEKGAWLHAKSLNTDNAWEAYEKLIDEYYRIKDSPALSKDQALVTVLRTTADLVENYDSVVKEQESLRKLVTQVDQKIEEQITLSYGEQRRLQKAVASRVYELFDNAEDRPKAFSNIYREIKDRFGVASYKDVRRKDLQAAINYVIHWIPRKAVI